MPILLESKEIRMAPQIYGKEHAYEVPGLKLLLLKNGRKYLGDGAECLVFERRQKNSPAIAINYYEFDKKDANALFLRQRLLHTLFPHNFPVIHTVYYGNTDTKTPGASVRQKINVLPIKPELDYRYLIKYPIDRVFQIMGLLGLPIQLDECYKNFGVGLDGGEYFLDTPKKMRGAGWKKETVIKYMKNDHGYSEHDIRTAARCIDKLVKLEQF